MFINNILSVHLVNFCWNKVKILKTHLHVENQWLSDKYYLSSVIPPSFCRRMYICMAKSVWVISVFIQHCKTKKNLFRILNSKIYLWKLLFLISRSENGKESFSYFALKDVINYFKIIFKNSPVINRWK